MRGKEMSPSIIVKTSTGQYQPITTIPQYCTNIGALVIQTRGRTLMKLLIYSPC